MAARSQLNIKIFSPYQTYYEGGGESLSAVNATGPFDVLANHANFFSLLTHGHLRVNTGYQQLDFLITRGILRVSRNEVTVFVDI